MNKKSISKTHFYIIVAASIILISACITIKISLAYGFLSSIIFTSTILIKYKYTLKDITVLLLSGLKEAWMLYVLILLIGAAASVWLASGVVPSLMYYGFEYMKGMNFLLATFLIVSVVSIFMGTAIGTVSTIGIALLGVGKGFGFPAPLLLGVIISGAFIADKLSPISGLFNLTLTTTKRSYKEVMTAMLPTFIPLFLITSIVYYLIGRNFNISTGSENLIYYQNVILGGFKISPFIALLPAIILIMSLFGSKTIPTILIGLFAGCLVSVLSQHMSLTSLLKSLFFGYHGSTASTELNKILISGGIKSMIDVVLIVMGAVSLTSLFEKTGMIAPLIEKLTSGVRTKRQLILKTALISSFLTIITCDQTVGILLPGRLLQDKYSELGVDTTILARTISDTGTIIAPLMVWNINALILKSLTGISATSYAPFAVLCYLSPIITIIVSYKLKEKQKSLEA
ncbi:sodium:proton antiporter [Clostridium estertheticum]|uniref:Na+/H+ antiporter NhaC family protein n=1 Tax=Clostridium estertheticum TaxID=238834 RepID=UPI0013E955F7|nr:Na+/H+ antiporter NhaC family protein [Clostridium estertheticum]MBZ9688596.1 sodium:proton antiporter [Clostridium estertheticum]